MSGFSCCAGTSAPDPGRTGLVERRALRPLDLHEGIGDVEEEAGPCGCSTTGLCEGCSRSLTTKCERWPDALRLRATGPDGVRFVKGRCRATNLCDYCAELAAVETSEMLLLDAMEDAPTLYVVLTARELLDRRECKRHLTQLRRTLRRRWPRVRWAVLVEFQRRGALHLNLLVKGVPVEDEDELRERVLGLWCARVDAERPAQWVGPVNEGGGLVRYIALHFLKPAQAPPKGWRGHRSSQARDYLVRPAAVMREEARASLRLKRRLWRAGAVVGVNGEREGIGAQLVEFVAAYLADLEAATSWELVKIRRRAGAAVFEVERVIA